MLVLDAGEVSDSQRGHRAADCREERRAGEASDRADDDGVDAIEADELKRREGDDGGGGGAASPD